MCGITGFYAASHADSTRILDKMTGALHTRGPDDQGTWQDAENGIYLGHRRLSILDLSPAGHQPMTSPDGRYVIVFNGEIYNHQALRTELGPGQSWRGHSDTETLLAGIGRWGLTQTLQKSVGMFALALWDRDTRTLTLARDRMGEKPLYYGWQGEAFLFGSELKALRAHPAFQGEIDRSAVAALLSRAAIPAPLSIYEGVRKLPPGTLMPLSAADRKTRRWPEPIPYWSVEDAVRAGQAAPFTGTPGEAVEELDRLLRKSIADQMIADVPLGAFLSGGIDSSAITALMQAQSARPVKTFSIGFHEDAFNEAQHAKAVAQHLGTDHTELYVTPQQTLDVIPHLPEIYDEPFADSSQIPTFLVSQMARQHVTVALSGDAGDELFGGYTRYAWTARIWGLTGRFPRPARRMMAGLLRALPPEGWDTLYKPLSPMLPARLRFSHPGDKVHKLARIIAARTPQEIYQGLLAYWDAPQDVVIGAASWPSAEPPPARTFVEEFMALDQTGYLPDDILVKVDRAAMAVSLETRAPFLDHRLVEFAWRLPLDLKVREGQGKWILRQVLDRYVPRDMIERPKQGFGVPIAAWLRGPLKDWAQDLLSEQKLKEDDLLNPAPIRQKWVEHLSGTRNWSSQLWTVLMLQQWRGAQKR